MTTAQEVVDVARTFIGTRYAHQGRLKGHGVDCAGLVIAVARELGLVAPDFDINGYERTADGVTLLAVCDRFMERVALHLLAPGHVLVYAFNGATPQHMGIVADRLYDGEPRLTLIQALGSTDGKGSVVEWRITAGRKGWTPIRAYALPGVA